MKKDRCTRGGRGCEKGSVYEEGGGGVGVKKDRCTRWGVGVKMDRCKRERTGLGVKKDRCKRVSK